MTPEELEYANRQADHMRDLMLSCRDKDDALRASCGEQISSQQRAEAAESRAARLEAELTAARTAAGIDAGMPMDEWINARRNDHAELRHKLNDAMQIARGFVAERDEARKQHDTMQEMYRADHDKLIAQEELIKQLNSEIAYLRSADHAADLAFERAQKIGATYVIDETPFGQMLDGQGDEVEP